ncbi:hypothetical protein PLCT2_01527 [Planctomycetaceae bacterium]|nr:hypothetical protein PLCT2_01527 [Planctomycetaceae bacterium]
MNRKPVRMPSIKQLKAYRLSRQIHDTTDELRKELWWADALQGQYGRDRVLATHMNKLSAQVGHAFKRGHANTVGVSEQLAMLADQVASQALLLQSLISYLEDDPNFDKTKLREIMNNLDAADGVIDGKLGGRKR